MNTSRWRVFGVAVAFAVVTFLFFQSRMLDFEEHERFASSLLRVRQVDADLNQDLLRIGYSLLTFYDPVNQKFAEIEELRGRLEPLPRFLDAPTNTSAQQLLDRFDEAVAQKRGVVEEFQAANIQLQISLGYLPVLAGELTALAGNSPVDRQLSAELKDLLRDVLLFMLSPEERMLQRIQECMASIEQMTPRASRALRESDLDLMTGHVRTILRNKPRVDQLNAKLAELPTGPTLRELHNLYDRAYQQASMRADAYRAYLYVFSLGLLIYVFYALYQLWQTTEELNRTNEGLEERVESRTQELARSQARNRALLSAIPDAILRISRDGTVLDVKESAAVPLAATPDRLVGRHLREVLPEAAEEGLKGLETALSTGQPQLVECERCIGGEARDLEARIVVGAQDQALLIVRDITEQKRATEEVAKAQRRSEQLLNNILPAEVADELKKKGMVDPKYFEDVTILFTNFVGFGTSTDDLAAEELVQVLHDYFTAFDEITVRYGLEKLKTVGDQYMCVGGLPVRKPSHPVDAVMAGLEMVEAVRRRDRPDNLVHWNVRIGVHTGPVVAGVVGFQKFAFDVWGQTVNFSSRVEANGAANRIHLSADTYSRVKDFFAVEYNGKLKTRYRELDTYFVEGLLPTMLNGDHQVPPAPFLNRYRIYFQSDPPSFPRFLVDA